MRVAFLLEAPNIRGSGVASYDYAHFNEEILQNESLFICNRAHEQEFHPLGQKRLEDRFCVVYLNDITSLDEALRRERVDFMYTIRTGHLEPGIPKDCPCGIHVMFQHYTPHGTVYAYVSQWLSLQAKQALGVDVPYVPHMVYGTQNARRGLRRRLGIPREAVVFGRYGGFTQFDLALAQQAVIEVLKKSEQHYFLFMNTKKFYEHPRIIYLPPTTEPNHKCTFIQACDAMLHARRLGESFGMSIAEFLYQGKPVIAWHLGNDLNHVFMLKEHGLFYQTKNELVSLLLGFDRTKHSKELYQGIVEPFSPERVMERFNQVFLQPIS